FNVQNLLLLLIPVLAAATSYLTVRYSTAKTSHEKTGNDMQASMQRKMTMISPLLSGFIAFTVPAGLGFYWIVGNVYQIIQQLFMNRFVIKKSAEAKVKQLPDETIGPCEQPGMK
ncbi:MAG: YidC/Oxa1 family membrane protein insertase, partial [Bacillota bacterium]